MNVESDGDQSLLRAILANLGREICAPLERLQGGIDALLIDPARPITEAQRGQALTMLSLCDDLTRLTRESLGGHECGEETGAGPV